jgi:RNA polymerase sigma-70 factor (ECF subfamily)
VSVNAPTESGFEEAACVERACRRDEDAARRLIGRLYPLVLKLVRAHLPRRASEEDMTQIVFMKVFANLDCYSGTVPLEHWVSRITINTCLNQLAAEKVRPELRWTDLGEEQRAMLEALAASPDELHPDQSLAAREIAERLLAALQPRDRMLLTLLHLEGHAPREVQRITGWNGMTVRVRAFRARQKLRRHFQHLTKEGRE